MEKCGESVAGLQSFVVGSGDFGSALGIGFLQRRQKYGRIGLGPDWGSESKNKGS